MNATDRFISEFETCQYVIATIQERKQATVTLRQAHELWWEHSQDYCAQWLVWRDENPDAEILQAFTKWSERHTPKF